MTASKSRAKAASRRARARGTRKKGSGSQKSGSESSKGGGKQQGVGQGLGIRQSSESGKARNRVKVSDSGKGEESG